MKVFSKRVDKIVGVSIDVSNFTGSKLNKPVITIPNPYTHKSLIQISKKRHNDFVFVARLTSQKIQN